MIDYNSKYLHKIETQADFNEKYNGSFYHEPWVSYTEESRKVKYNKKMEDRYLTFDIISGGTIQWTSYNGTIERTIEYSKNGGEWTEITSTGASISVEAGDKLMFRGENDNYTEIVIDMYMTYHRYAHFGNSSGARFNVQGNIMSMIYGDAFIGNREFPSGSSMNFSGLFYNCTGLINAKDLILPATALTESCYGMFFDYGLHVGTNNSDDEPCGMFDGCSNLVTIPDLKATVLASSCYGYMFRNCTSLTYAPKLPVQEIAFSCYGGMFRGCTALEECPELPAMTVESASYCYMFEGCTSITATPELNATVIDAYSYACMFKDCTNLVEVPNILPAMTLAYGCYTGMFYGCSNITTAPILPAETLVTICYGYHYGPGVGYGMFSGCTKLNYVKCLAVNTGYDPGAGASNPTYGYFLSGAGSEAISPTFVAHDANVNWARGDNGVPTNWTIVYEN